MRRRALHAQPPPRALRKSSENLQASQCLSPSELHDSPLVTGPRRGLARSTQDPPVDHQPSPRTARTRWIRAPCKPPSNPTPKEIPHDHEISRADMRIHDRSAHIARVRHRRAFRYRAERDGSSSPTGTSSRPRRARMAETSRPPSRQSPPSAPPRTSRAFAGGRPAGRPIAGTRSSSMRCRKASSPCRCRRATWRCSTRPSTMPWQLRRIRTATANRSDEIDAALRAAPRSSSSPSQHAAAATTAAAVLGYLFPARAEKFSAMAEEAMQMRLTGGMEYPARRGRRPHDRRAHCRVGDRARQGRPLRCKVDRQRAARPWPMAGHQSDRADGRNLAAVGAVVAKRIPPGRTAGGRFR